MPPSSLALLTDLYQLTMAAGFHALGRGDEIAAFHLTFRRHPFAGGYTVAAGLEAVVEFIESFRFTDDDRAYLATLTGNDGAPLFEASFLDTLRALELTVDLDAIPEGTVVFPHEPLLRVTGPILQCQLLETALLNIINFQTLIATKATRIVRAARGAPVLEFGLRRAQGVDGALTASRAAYVGGCAATSNVLAGKRYGIPVRGTHAHSWVMSFDDEAAAFEAYADAMPNNCVFLVDTYDTIEGVRLAITVGRSLRERGFEMVGIRLDSGDLAYLSTEARRMLDDAGFPDAAIVASNDLDEHLIESLHHQHAPIGVFGVGTRLVTAYDQPALGGVYKLSALRDASGGWQPKIKLSEHVGKVSTPGRLQVRRFELDGRFVADAIHDIDDSIGATPTIVDAEQPLRRRPIPDGATGVDLLVPVMRGGARAVELPFLDDIRAHRAQQISRLHETICRLDNPHRYPAGLESTLHDRRVALIEAARSTPA